MGQTNAMKFVFLSIFSQCCMILISWRCVALVFFDEICCSSTRTLSNCFIILINHCSFNPTAPGLTLKYIERTHKSNPISFGGLILEYRIIAYLYWFHHLKLITLYALLFYKLHYFDVVFVILRLQSPAERILVHDKLTIS